MIQWLAGARRTASGLDEIWGQEPRDRAGCQWRVSSGGMSACVFNGGNEHVGLPSRTRGAECASVRTLRQFVPGEPDRSFFGPCLSPRTRIAKRGLIEVNVEGSIEQPASSRVVVARCNRVCGRRDASQAHYGVCECYGIFPPFE